MTTARGRRTGVDIAVVGLSCRFPGAADADEFWDNVVAGTESVRTFSAAELAADGVDPGLLQRPDFVAAGGELGDVDLFDAGFFGYTPREAELLDPQQRLFLEHAWWAMEDAGYDVDRVTGPVGVFAGCAMSSYLPLILRNPALFESVGWFQTLISNDKDYLATRVSYKLDLRGPSVVVQTACSTGLVAIQYAVRSLVAGECRMAMAGASTVRLPERGGHLHSPGGIYSPQGHCRPFDATADGTVFGNGVGVVVLKRLADALEDGDPIRAVVKGGAVNNDGNDKVGFTAPSLAGQTAVIEAAHLNAGVSPDTISYVEAHGTGTHLGDPIEVEALTTAFRRGTDRSGYCALGAVKASIGHLDPTAGVAGFVKTVLALEHGTLPPVANFERANEEIDFAATPFFVNEEARPWTDRPRRAGVSAFGIGGTNAHVVLEQAPARVRRTTRERPEVLLLSGRSEEAVAASAERLAAHLETHPDLDLGDVAHTLKAGRHRFGTRASVTAGDTAEAVTSLRSGPRAVVASERPVVLLFPGQGSQHVGMAHGVLAAEPAYAAAYDECVRLVRECGGPDLAAILADPGPEAEALLAQTSVTQPALFTVEYALARLWQSWGVQPAALLGHSVGEYVAATVAGVMRLEDAVAVVTERGRLMQAQPPGAMLAVPLPEVELAPRLGPDVAVAAVNEPGSCIVAGDHPAIDRLAEGLAADGVDTQRLRTSHAFHSPMMDGVLEPLREVVARVPLSAPSVPFVSNVSGTWIRDDEARDPEYWTRQLRQPVRFADGVRTLLESAPDGRLLLEVGPGQTLAGLARRNPARRPSDTMLASLPHAHSTDPDHDVLLGALGRVWCEGVPVHRPSRDGARRVSLPGYAFQHRSYWALPKPVVALPPAPRPLDEWVYQPQWQDEPLVDVSPDGDGWVVSGAAGPIARAVLDRLSVAGAEASDATGATPLPESVRRVVHLVLPPRKGADRLDGYTSVVELAQALVRSRVHTEVDVLVATTGTQRVVPGDDVDPERAQLEAACLTTTQEYPNLRFRLLDLAPGAPELVADAIVAECAGGSGFAVARRGERRVVRRLVPVPLPAPAAAPVVRDGDVVLVTGGLGGVGLALAGALAAQARIRLVLLGRTGVPPRSDWPAVPADSPLGRRIRALRVLWSAGAQWEVVEADLTDPGTTRAALADVMARYGGVDLVVHAAGSVAPEAFFGIEEVDATRSEAVWRAKTEGLVTLHDALSARPPRTWVLVSSLSTVLGGLGFTAYAAGNTFLDAFAERHDGEDGARWLSIDWDAWRFDQPADAAADDTAITVAQGGEVLTRLLGAGTPARVVVSTTDLSERLTRWVGDRAVGAASSTGSTPGRTDVRDVGGVESVVAGIWVDLIGVDEARPEDDFFTDLGGHSLLATQVASRLRSVFDVEITLRQFLETPTLHGLATTIWTTLQDRDPSAAPQDDPPRSIPRLDRRAHRRTTPAKEEAVT